MKDSALAVVVTGVIAAGAGIAIAGLPAASGTGDLTITTRPATTPVSARSDDAPTTTVTTSSTTDSARTTTITTIATTSAAPTTTDGRTTTTEAPRVLRDPAELDVATANAGAAAGVATRTADTLREFGYEASPVDAEGASSSKVFYDPGFRSEAARLTEQLGWAIDDVGPMADLPPLRTERTFDLVVVIGDDRA